MDWYLVQTLAIRAHNDELRTRLRGGSVTIAEEIQELGATVVANALVTMAEGTEFDDEEHQRGHFIFCARCFRWLITYGSSTNPANSKITRRELHLWI